jgi:hypothetical protein
MLVLTGLIKLISSTKSVGILKEPDPVFGISNRLLIRTAGVTEVLLALSIAVLNTVTAIRLVAFSALNFLVYRMISFALAPGAPCPCLGYIHAWIGMSDKSANWVTLALLMYMCIGSWYFLFLPNLNESHPE